MIPLEILARAFLGGLIELHGREHAPHVLEALAKGVAEGRPIGGCCGCNGKPENENVETRADQSAAGLGRRLE